MVVIDTVAWMGMDEAFQLLVVELVKGFCEGLIHDNQSVVCVGLIQFSTLRPG